MLPALVSAMAACTWHLFDNPRELQGLVVFQAGTTLLGNVALAAAAWRLLPERSRS
jgi:putative salt-induced outer membrane protein YdiY